MWHLSVEKFHFYSYWYVDIEKMVYLIKYDKKRICIWKLDYGILSQNYSDIFIFKFYTSKIIVRFN